MVLILLFLPFQVSVPSPGLYGVNVRHTVAIVYGKPLILLLACASYSRPMHSVDATNRRGLPLISNVLSI